MASAGVDVVASVQVQAFLTNIPPQLPNATHCVSPVFTITFICSFTAVPEFLTIALLRDIHLAFSLISKLAQS
jgi:hypothetical protein